ncbi:hypothetical protein ACWD7C_38415, partial [Streptomyces sp. NPDC005134]
NGPSATTSARRSNAPSRSRNTKPAEDKRQAEVPDVYKLEDDTVMQWRNASKSGGETIDIAPGSGGKALKVHLPNE